jgi:CDP-glycerol glycerophosphotransferase
MRQRIQRTSELAYSWLLPRILWLLRMALPVRQHIVVTGYPPTEGNVVRLVGALLERSQRPIVWLDPPQDAFLVAQGINPTDSRLRRVPKVSVTAMAAYCTARFVFSTHGLYSDPAAVSRKPVVNLWHGEGLKVAAGLFHDRSMSGKRSNYVVGSTRLWGLQLGSLSRLPYERVLLTGAPRNDDLFRPISSSGLMALDIDPDRPFVLWMPTFRRSAVRTHGVDRSRLDTLDTTLDEALASYVNPIAAVLRAAGVQLIVKPHPLDATARSVRGAIVIENDTLDDAGVALYSLLAASVGLLSDTSSVWVDYLLLDRPIGFVLPDVAAVTRTRAIYPLDGLDWLPGLTLDSPENTAEFVRDLQERGARSRGMRARTAEWCGLVYGEDFSMRLIDALSVLEEAI